MSEGVWVLLIGLVQIGLAFVAPDTLKAYPTSRARRALLGKVFGTLIVLLGVVLIVVS